MRFPRLRPLAGVAILGAIVSFAPLATARAADLARTITVSGSGVATTTPDQVQLSAGVTTTAATAAAALAENSGKMNAVFDTLKRIGIPDKAIQTSNFSASPQYSPYNQNASGLQRIVSYQVSNQIDITLGDPKRLGPVLDALVTAGANQINSVSFSIKDVEALETTARESAIADAHSRAQTYAKAAGVALGGVVAIQEGSVEPPQPIYRAMATTVAAPPPPTAAGEQSVTANVTVVFELK